LTDHFQKLEPHQYYYPASDLHITIFDFIQAQTDFQRDEALEKIFLEIATQAVNGFGAFNIQMKGVVFSNEAGLIRGFDGNKLLFLRENIRSLRTEAGLRNDERYESESAHVTFTRFKNRLEDPITFYTFIEASKMTYLGEESVNQVELVEHDWYNSTPTKRVIARIQLD